MHRTCFGVIFYLVVTSVLFTPFVFGGDMTVGIGISATDEGGSIYMPIRMGSMLIEPMVRYVSDETEYKSEYYGVSKGSYKELGLGIGFYFVSSLFEKADLLVGLKGMAIEYQKEETTDLDSNYYTEKSVTTTDANGLMIAPTVGVEYRIADHLSAGMYASLEYWKFSGDEKTVSSGNTSAMKDYDREVKRTSTDVFLKYYF